MGLTLSKELSTGETADYWRISKIIIDRLRRVTNLTVSLYKSKEIRDKGKLPVDELISEVSGVPDSDPVGWSYKMLKEQPDFAKAVDS